MTNWRVPGAPPANPFVRKVEDSGVNGSILVDGEEVKVYDDTSLQDSLTKKADTISVDGKLAKKADLTEVNTKLAEKVSKVNGVLPDVNGNVTIEVPEVDTSALATKTELETVTSELAQTANEIDWISVENFPLQSPETDDTARINRAIASISSGDVLVPKGVYNISGNGILIPPNINLKMSTEAEFVYSGTSTCLKFEGGRNGNHVVGKVRKGTLDWKTTDTSSAGVEIKNINHSVFTILSVWNFHDGIKLSANGDGSGFNTGGGTSYNTITLGQITDNKLGLSFKQTNFGWINGNTFIGGAVRINSNNASIAGSMLIDMTQTGNGNVFTGVNLEGSAQEKTVVISASNNTFINCRFEANPVESFHLLSSSINNQVIGGYDNFGHKSKIFKDEGQGNFILGGRGVKLFGDNGTYGGEALALQGMVSNSDIMLLVQNFQKKNFVKLASNGIFSFFGTNGEKDDVINPTGYTNPAIRINPSNFSIETSNQAGDVAPTPLFEVWTTNRVNLKKQLHLKGGRISSDIVSFTQNSTTPDVSTSNKFLTNSTSSTTITGFGGGADGQEILIIGNDTLTTIKNSANVILKGAVDLTLKVNDSISLMRLANGNWIELHRNIF